MENPLLVQGWGCTRVFLPLLSFNFRRKRAVLRVALAAAERVAWLLEAQGPRALALGCGCSSSTSENWLLVHKS